MIGRCIVCGATVWYVARHWRNTPTSHRVHVCREDRSECGALMPFTKERCARTPGHADSHRSRWVLDDTAARRRKWRAA